MQSQEPQIKIMAHPYNRSKIRKLRSPDPCLYFEVTLAHYAHGLIQSGLPTELKKKFQCVF